MTDLLSIALLVLVITFVVGLVPLLRAHRSADRMLAAQLLGTNGVGIVLLLSPLLGLSALTDVALVLALLAAVAVVAFTRGPAKDEEVS